MSEAPMMEIGPSKEAVVKIGGVILAILRSKQDQETMQTALRVLQKATTVKHVTVSGCNFTRNP